LDKLQCASFHFWKSRANEINLAVRYGGGDEVIWVRKTWKILIRVGEMLCAGHK
jgi:hypothetical protein